MESGLIQIHAALWHELRALAGRAAKTGSRGLA